MDWRAHIEQNPEVMYGKPVLKGTRIPVDLITEKLALGETIEDLTEAYPTLNRKKILACLAYVTDLYQSKKPRTMELALSDQQLKQLIKAALIEVLTERQDLLAEALREALEDYHLGQAIQEGIEHRPTPREEVFKLFDQAD